MKESLDLDPIEAGKHYIAAYEPHPGVRSGRFPMLVTSRDGNRMCVLFEYPPAFEGGRLSVRAAERHCLEQRDGRWFDLAFPGGAALRIEYELTGDALAGFRAALAGPMTAPAEEDSAA
jgi:hypothetical protein